MNAGELTRLRQKAAIRYIARTNVTDSSLLTWKKQVGPTYADSGRPPVVGNYGINAGTGVMEFANGKSSDLPRGNALFDSKTVEENVRFPLDMFTDFSLAEKNKTVSETLARVNLLGVNEKYPAEISGGMKKRVALARAIIMKPKYLFCDEPNSGLDPQTSMVIDKLIQDITTEFNITTIVVTHDMNSVMEIGKHIIYLHQGKKEWEGTNAEIIYSKNELLNNFIFASKFLQDAKSMRMTKQ